MYDCVFKVELLGFKTFARCQIPLIIHVRNLCRICFASSVLAYFLTLQIIGRGFKYLAINFVSFGFYNSKS